MSTLAQARAQQSTLKKSAWKSPSNPTLCYAKEWGTHCLVKDRKTKQRKGGPPVLDLGLDLFCISQSAFLKGQTMSLAIIIHYDKTVSINCKFDWSTDGYSKFLVVPMM